ncbi:uncharacterized protein LOC119367578 [Triticum dicoccoides]|uniref:uncharacterized protein LOC119367578 n=1 Tax=Triticum dicoccoides TaxID=85692 RepID=UPI00188DCA5F|nr:uncharacterized protein LOC119367578 [Triticum dicoccoides]
MLSAAAHRPGDASPSRALNGGNDTPAAPCVSHDEPPSPTPKASTSSSDSPSPLLLCLGHRWRGEGRRGSAGSLADSAHGHAVLPTRACISTNGALRFRPRHRRIPANSRLDGGETCSSIAAQPPFQRRVRRGPTATLPVSLLYMKIVGEIATACSVRISRGIPLPTSPSPSPVEVPADVGHAVRTGMPCSSPATNSLLDYSSAPLCGSRGTAARFFTLHLVSGHTLCAVWSYTGKGSPAPRHFSAVRCTIPCSAQK